jgi:hypothetical protein
MALFGRESAADEARARRIKAWAEARSPYALFSTLLGVLAVLDFFTVVLGMSLGTTAIVLGALGLRDLRRRPHLTGARLCRLGVVLGGLALIGSSVMACVFYG